MNLLWRGCVPYEEMLLLQEAQRAARMRGEAADELWLLEHPAVITAGRRMAGEGRPEGLPEEIGWVATGRGGLATCHEPGQLVGYLLMDAGRIGPKRLVRAVEEGLIGWLAGAGVAASVVEGLPGVWTEGGKVAAIGMQLERGYTMHGFALNLCNDLAGFGWIVPCGLAGRRVTTVERLTGARRTPEEVWAAVGAAVAVELKKALDASGGAG